jgi:hypothetical protein
MVKKSTFLMLLFFVANAALAQHAIEKDTVFSGGSNYYGAGVQFKVTDKFGFGVGVINSYYRKNWTAQPYFAPVAF